MADYSFRLKKNARNVDGKPKKDVIKSLVLFYFRIIISKIFNLLSHTRMKSELLESWGMFDIFD